MDEMKITSKFTTYLVSKLMQKAVKKKFGYEIDIQLNNLQAYVIDEKMQVHLDIDAELNRDVFNQIVKDVGLKD